MIEEIYSYERPMVHPEWDRGGRIDHAIHDVRSALYTISHMLGLVLETGDAVMPSVSTGVCLLIEQQCLLLNGIAERFPVERFPNRESEPTRADEALPEPARQLRIAFIESNTKAGVDAGLIGAALNIPRDDIERVVSQLRGAATGAQGGKTVGAPRRASAQA